MSSDSELTGEQAIRQWLLDYAWAESTEAGKEAVVDCIMAQEQWQHLSALVDRYAGMHESGGGPEAMDDATEFVLSSLYECHAGPHLPTCPEAGK